AQPARSTRGGSGARSVTRAAVSRRRVILVPGKWRVRREEWHAHGSRPVGMVRLSSDRARRCRGSVGEGGEEVLVPLPGGELVGHELLLLGGQAVDLLLLVRELLEVRLVDL